MIMQNVASCQVLTPDMAVELFPQHIKQSHHWHIENEEAHQSRSAEEAEKRIHPNPSGEKHPDYPAEDVQEEKTTSDCFSIFVILYLYCVWRQLNVCYLDKIQSVWIKKKPRQPGLNATLSLDKE